MAPKTGFPRVFLTCGKCHSENPQNAARFTCKLKMVLSGDLRTKAMTRSKSQKVPPFSADRSFPYVLVCSMLGTVVSLASVWIVTAHSFAQAMVA